MIGSISDIADPDRQPLTPPVRVVQSATAMGLVAVDSSGQIEPALAESWIVTDDGLSVIFRIKRLRWPDGRDVTGPDVAASLERALAPASRNPLKPLMSSVEAVIAMTGRVVELRLRVPRPHLLELLAQPELGIRRKGIGLGPWIANRFGPDDARLELAQNGLDDADADVPKTPDIVIHARRAAMAIARFLARRSDAVLGGTLADWPLIAASGARTPRIDPALGLFGLAVDKKSLPLSDPRLRQALTMAIDRPALTAAFGIPGWQPVERLLPKQLDSSAPLPAPPWLARSLGERRRLAAALVQEIGNGDMPPLKVAVPQGPGVRILFAALQADWRRIGVRSLAVPIDARNADLHLIDEVAPNASANWFLTRTGCDSGFICSPVGDLALNESRMAAGLESRSLAIARAVAAEEAAATFIPLATPLRWSLMAPSLTGFHENSFAIHPLGELRVSAP